MAFRLIFGIFFLIPITLFAQNTKVEINVTAEFKPTSGVGLIITETGTKQISSGVEINQKGNKLYVVSVPIQPEFIDNNASITAIVKGDNGEYAAGDVKLASIPSMRQSHLSLPDCKIDPSKINLPQLEANKGLFESLRDLRSSRKDVAKLTVRGMLSGPLLEKLRKLENSLGFTLEKELSPDLTPFELLERVNRIEETLKRFDKK